MGRATKPISETIRGLRQKPSPQKKGGWRIWWEPTAEGREAGFANHVLDATRPTWSVAEARRLNASLDAKVGRRRRRAPRFLAVDDLIHGYLASDAFREKSDATQRDYRQALGVISRQIGAQNHRNIGVPEAQALVDNVRKNSGKGMAIKIKRLGSIVFGYAITIGLRERASNVFADVRTALPPPGKSVASWGVLDAFTSAADALGGQRGGWMRVAIPIYFYHGDRVGDLHKAPLSELRLYERDTDGTLLTARADKRHEPWEVVQPDTERDEAAIEAARLYGQLSAPTGSFVTWHYVRSKRQNTRSVLFRPEVRDLIWQRLTTISREAVFLFEAKLGRPASYWQWRDAFNDIRALASESEPAAAKISMRDLRRTHATMARRGGASLTAAAASLGNTADRNQALEETYMPQDFVTGTEAAMKIRRPATTQFRASKFGS